MSDAIPVFSSPSPKVRKVGLERPWMWLAAAWHDLCAAPVVSLTYGLLFALAGLAISVGVWLADVLYLALPLTAGFLLLGPILAVGLYEVSRRLHAGEGVTLGTAFLAWKRNGGQIALMGLVLMLFFLAWIRIATLIFALFFSQNPPDPNLIFEKVFFLVESLPFLAVGCVIGAILSALVFAISAVSIPMLLDRDTNVITAVATSVAAVKHNIPTMSVWAGLIVLFATAGLVTFYLGLIIALPLVGHATWHAYRETVGR